ncbi:uncharacterized protein A1O5_04346 [Cladophialophora psammophila CBS 110553]|uniref:Xylanolytic transcriptional activator regulatory domain-containing protein n=1 Tax=Cladophialophora psammophila CBS 110553 TaxID=1182543 RepID=W9X3J6_9EURO|nr:uncharacterized protein A1O5_04346 [Cladophialophora psammophila CBS 110553]EXJ71845.1 hypothetical protein A1O5_04346 [Cladophialophora psammophila CBS 110553]
MRNESLDHGVGYQREPEPDPETARKWIAAYFDESLESIYGVIHRPQFEARIRRHFASSLNDDDNDPAWYALRNAVYATGCRYVLSDPQQPQSFLAARSQSWKYYENALSVHTDLLYTKTNLTSIQALIIMAFFAEALGSPTLEFILVLNATRLAQLKAMHLEVSKSWNLSEESTMDRYWLWWTLYAYEKHLAFRSGHPSTIDDEDISCPLPQSTKSENPVKAEFCLGIIKHSQLCSQVQKRLWTVKALRQSPKETVAVVEDLQRQLEKWHQSLPAGFRQAAPFKNLELPPDFHFYHGIYYHFAYNAVQIAINTALCYPWVRAGHRDLADSNIQRQQRLCLVRVAEASRSIITATQRLDVNATSPVS